MWCNTPHEHDEDPDLPAPVLDCNNCNNRSNARYNLRQDYFWHHRHTNHFLFDAYRPQENNYDQVYHDENSLRSAARSNAHAESQNAKGKATCTRLNIRRRLWANNEIEAQREIAEYLVQDEWEADVKAVYINDAHYYLQDVQFNQFPDETMLYCSGAEFHPIPGDYRLPDGCGSYTVDRGMVYMTTTGSGNSYSHPLVVTNMEGKRFPMGWYTPFHGNMRANRFQVT